MFCNQKWEVFLYRDLHLWNDYNNNKKTGIKQTSLASDDMNSAKHNYELGKIQSTSLFVISASFPFFHL